MLAYYSTFLKSTESGLKLRRTMCRTIRFKLKYVQINSSQTNGGTRYYTSEEQKEEVPNADFRMIFKQTNTVSDDFQKYTNFIFKTFWVSLPTKYGFKLSFFFLSASSGFRFFSSSFRSLLFRLAPKTGNGTDFLLRGRKTGPVLRRR